MPAIVVSAIADNQESFVFPLPSCEMLCRKNKGVVKGRSSFRFSTQQSVAKLTRIAREGGPGWQARKGPIIKVNHENLVGRIARSDERQSRGNYLSLPRAHAAARIYDDP